VALPVLQYPQALPSVSTAGGPSGRQATAAADSSSSGSGEVALQKQEAEQLLGVTQVPYVQVRTCSVSGCVH
jgi:hypothetical protein